MPNRIDAGRLQDLKAFVPQEGKLLDNAEKAAKVDNDISLIQFFDQVSSGETKPMLLTTPSPVVDVKKKAVLVKVADDNARQELRADAGKLGELLSRIIADNRDYLYPAFGDLEGAPTRYKFNNIVGMRVAQFQKEALALAKDLYPSGPDLDKALWAINTQTRDLWDRDIKFDDFEINGYGSFGHDAAFIHVYERVLADLEAVDTALLTPVQQGTVERQKKQLQNEIDDIFRHKYVYNSSSMFEVNAEVSIGLVAIDKASRQRISECKESLKSLVPEYELLNVTVDGENKAVFYCHDEGKHYFDGTAQQLTDDQVSQVQRRKLDARETAQLTFRRAKSGETLRKNFRFDWDGNGYVQRNKIDWVSWGGHCNDKAALEAAGLVVPRDHDGVMEYSSASGETVHYTPDLLNEELLSFSEMSSRMSRKTGGDPVADIGQTEFAGARDDDRPDRLKLSNGREIPLQARQNDHFVIKTIEKAGKTYQASESFREYLVAADQKSAEKNPLYKETTDGDYINLDVAQAAITVDVKVEIFDESGYPDIESKQVTLDFENPAAEPILIDSVMNDPGKREMYEIFLDTKTKEWCYQLIRMEAGADGKFAKKIINEMRREPFDPKSLVAMRETSLDNPDKLLPFIRDARATGRNATAETADGAGVWNGRMKSLGQKLAMREGGWERVVVSVDARYGGNHGAYLAKLNDRGEEEFYVPLAMPSDFFWRSQIAFAAEKDGLVNTTALNRGVISVENGTVHAEALENMLEILHCAFGKRHYTILHEGKRYFFENKASWEAAVETLKEKRAAVYQTDVPGPDPVVGRGQLLEHKGHVDRNKVESFSVIAEADGEMTVNLATLDGDADLYVNVGGAADTETHSHRSWEGGRRPDKITLTVEKGQTYGIAVHGYKPSDYELTVTGPKAGTVPEPDLPPIDFAKSGIVEHNQEELFELTVPKNGTLKVLMEGTGDADFYLKINEVVSADNWDLRPYESGSNEGGEIKVKAGDKIYGLVRGYGSDPAEYNLKITSEWS